jgi:putative transposase
MISVQDRKNAISLVREAVDAGARQSKTYGLLGISERTLQRWQKPAKNAGEDLRPYTQRVPANKLSDEERQEILKIGNSQAYKSLPPSQIVPVLADNGIYVASESSFHRTLHEQGQQTHRGKSQACKAGIFIRRCQRKRDRPSFR